MQYWLDDGRGSVCLHPPSRTTGALITIQLLLSGCRGLLAGVSRRVDDCRFARKAPARVSQPRRRGSADWQLKAHGARRARAAVEAKLSVRESPRIRRSCLARDDRARLTGPPHSTGWRRTL